jgi:hypothetical protein
LTRGNRAFRLEATVLRYPWLSRPHHGRIAAGAISVELLYDSTGLAVGDYTGNLDVESSDPDEAVTTVPVTLTVLADVEFIYYDLEDVVGAGEAIYLAGDFNGWNTTATPMTPNGDSSIFTVTVPLLPNTYEYKYVVYTDTVPTGPAHWDWLQSYPDGHNHSVIVTGTMTVENTATSSLATM